MAPKHPKGGRTQRVPGAVKKDHDLSKQAAGPAALKVSGKTLNSVLKLKDPWQDAPQATCDTCLQLTSTVDRQSSPDKQKLVYWVQGRWSAKLRKQVPTGHECYPCFFVRRKHFNMIDQKALNTQMKGSSAVGDKVMEVRADHVGEYGKYKKEGWIDLTAILEKSDQGYSDRFVEGRFEPLWEFADARKLSAASDTDLCELIAQRYPTYNIVYDKAGTLGVDIPDTVGGAYRYRRGAKESVTLRIQSNTSNMDDAKDTFATLLAKKEVDRIAAQVDAEASGHVEQLKDKAFKRL